MRIINDYYKKQDKLTFDKKFMSEEFYDTRKSVREMYGYLDDKGILKNVSFEYYNDSSETVFAFDAGELEAYRAEMLKSGTYKAELAVKCIFDEEYSQCNYCGAIELSWTMRTYRDNCGCIGRSWECGMCQAFNMKTLVKINEIKETKGVKEAVSALWKLIDWQKEKETI